MKVTIFHKPYRGGRLRVLMTWPKILEFAVPERSAGRNQKKCCLQEENFKLGQTVLINYDW